MSSRRTSIKSPLKSLKLASKAHHRPLSASNQQYKPEDFSFDFDIDIDLNDEEKVNNNREQQHVLQDGDLEDISEEEIPARLIASASSTHRPRPSKHSHRTTQSSSLDDSSFSPSAPYSTSPPNFTSMSLLDRHSYLQHVSHAIPPVQSNPVRDAADIFAQLSQNSRLAPSEIPQVGRKFGLTRQQMQAYGDPFLNSGRINSIEDVTAQTASLGVIASQRELREKELRRKRVAAAEIKRRTELRQSQSQSSLQHENAAFRYRSLGNLPIHVSSGITKYESTRLKYIGWKLLNFTAQEIIRHTVKQLYKSNKVMKRALFILVTRKKLSSIHLFV